MQLKLIPTDVTSTWCYLDLFCNDATLRIDGLWTCCLAIRPWDATPKRLSPCKSSVLIQNSMAHCRKVGPCKSPCNWFSPMAHRDHRIKTIMICLCFGWQSQWHTAIEVFHVWIGFFLIKNIVLHPSSQWHKRFQTPYVAVIHHSCSDYVACTKTAWHTMVHHLWKYVV